MFPELDGDFFIQFIPGNHQVSFMLCLFYDMAEGCLGHWDREVNCCHLPLVALSVVKIFGAAR